MLAGTRATRRHVDAVVRGLVGIPAEPDPEHEAAVARLVERGDRLRRDDRVALSDQTDASPEQTRSVTAAAVASATNGSSVRLYSSASSASPVGAGVMRLVGMCVCSGR